MDAGPSGGGVPKRDRLQVGHRDGGLDAPRAASDFALNSDVHTFLKFPGMCALHTPRFSFKPWGERKLGSGEEARGRGGDRWAEKSLCSSPLSYRFPLGQALPHTRAPRGLT